MDKVYYKEIIKDTCKTKGAEHLNLLIGQLEKQKQVSFWNDDTFKVSDAISVIEDVLYDHFKKIIVDKIRNENKQDRVAKGDTISGEKLSKALLGIESSVDKYNGSVHCLKQIKFVIDDIRYGKIILKPKRDIMNQKSRDKSAFRKRVKRVAEDMGFSMLKKMKEEINLGRGGISLSGLTKDEAIAIINEELGVNYV